MLARFTPLFACCALLSLAPAALAQGAGAPDAPADPPADAAPADVPPADAPPTEAGAAPDAAAADAAPAPEAPAPEAATPEAATPEAPPAGEAGAAGLSEEEQAQVADARAGDSAVEKPGETYLFLGARYRAIIVPKFMINLFGDGGTDVLVHGFGPEFAIRKDGFEYNLSIWYARYFMDENAFKAASDGEKAWEIVKSELHIVYLTADFLWSTEFSPAFSLNYGGAAGFGFVFGDLYRTQAYPPGGVFTNEDDLQKCAGPGDPRDTGGFCGDDNDHYNDYTEPNWANGGSLPIIFPWLALQTGLRFKFSKSALARIDLGFGTSGFFAGLGLDYGL